MSRTLDWAVQQTYALRCKGRNENHREVLQTPVDVQVKIYQLPGSNTLSSTVTCPYITGAHGQRCKASHPEVDNVGEGVGCPYSFDIPFALDR